MKREVKKLLEPFIKWKPKLQPALPDLTERVIEAIFWQEVSDVIAVSDNLILFWPSMRVPFWQSLTSNLANSLNGKLDQGELESLQDDLEKKLGFGLKGGLRIENSLWRALKKHWYGLDTIERQTKLRGEMQHNLKQTVFLAAGFCLAGDKDKNFQPLFDLWLKGNLPLWFDSQGKLVILCGRPF